MKHDRYEYHRFDTRSNLPYRKMRDDRVREDFFCTIILVMCAVATVLIFWPVK